MIASYTTGVEPIQSSNIITVYIWDLLVSILGFTMLPQSQSSDIITVYIWDLLVPLLGFTMMPQSQQHQDTPMDRMIGLAPSRR